MINKNPIKFLLSILTFFLLIVSCKHNNKLKVVLSKFSNDSVREVIYYDLPITLDSIGMKEVYFENGKIHAKGKYKNGKRTGKWVCYRRTGKLEWRADYFDGKENGITECFNENGNWRKMTVTKGVNNGPTIEFNIDSTGRQVWVYGQYKDCKEDGLWIWKNKDKKVLMKEFFKNGIPDKTSENFYENGAIKSRAFLRNGDIDSMHTFDSLGKLIKTVKYRNTIWTHSWMD